ncbi:muscle LIM protein 1 isoform X4 [Aedes albopictus]|uniref:LIM zinc-binding domain-containing protein n=1 Tax=Aedes albopictus TaxID=7160 RepID=A0ABM1YRX0_AEDAL
MPFKPAENPKCPKCGKSVYAAEERVAGGHKWHKGCFKCGMCGKMLDSTNCAEHENELYCKNCHGRKYGPKGYGFGGGAGCLSMDSGAQFQGEGPTTRDASSAATARRIWTR